MSWNPFRRKPSVMMDGEPGTGFDYSPEGEEYQRRKVLEQIVPTRQPFKWDLGGPRRKIPDPKEVYRQEMQQRLNANPGMFNSPGQQPEYTQQVNPFVRAQQRQPEPEPTPDQFIFNKRAGGYDTYGGLDVRPGEIPAQAKRRMDMQTAMIGGGDPTNPDAAMFATPGETGLGPLDRQPTGPTLPKDIPPEGMGGKAPTSPFSRRLNRPMDTVEEDEQRLRELEDKPEGFWKRLGVAATQGLRAATDQPITPIATRRDRDILKFQNRIKRGLEQQQKDMVDVQLGNGEWVRVPARSAGALQSRQQEIDLRGDRLKLQKDRWDKMSVRDRQREVGAMYRAGGLNTPEGLEYAARELNIPVALMPKFMAGQLRDKIDDNGNLMIENVSTGVATPVTNVQGQPVKSFETTKQTNQDKRQRFAEAEKNRRFNATLQQRKDEAARKAAAAGNKSGVKISQKDKDEIAKGYGELDEYINKISAIDGDIDKANALPAGWKEEEKDPKSGAVISVTTKNDRLAQLGRKRASVVGASRKRMLELNQRDPNNEWGSGERGFPYRKERAGVARSDLDNPIVGRPTRSKGTLQGAIDAFKVKAGREPNAQELENIKRVFRQ